MINIRDFRTWNHSNNSVLDNKIKNAFTDFNLEDFGAHFSIEIKNIIEAVDYLVSLIEKYSLECDLEFTGRDKLIAASSIVEGLLSPLYFSEHSNLKIFQYIITVIVQSKNMCFGNMWGEIS